MQITKNGACHQIAYCLMFEKLSSRIFFKTIFKIVLKFPNKQLTKGFVLKTSNWSMCSLILIKIDWAFYCCNITYGITIVWSCTLTFIKVVAKCKAQLSLHKNKISTTHKHELLKLYLM